MLFIISFLICVIDDFKYLKQKTRNLIFITLFNINYYFLSTKRRSARNKKSKIDVSIIITMITIEIIIMILKDFNDRIIRLTFIL